MTSGSDRLQATASNRHRRRVGFYVIVLGLLAFWVGSLLRRTQHFHRGEGDTTLSPRTSPETHPRANLDRPNDGQSNASRTLPSLPAPKFEAAAYRDFRAQAKQRGSKSADNYHAAESRNANWAPQMERQIQERFDVEVLETLRIPGLKVEKLDCRTSSCRLEVSWSLEDLSAAHDSPDGQFVDPLVLLGRSTGPLATLQQRVSPKPGDLVVPSEWNVVHGRDGRFHTATILLFSDRDIDPDTYREVTAQAARHMLPNGTPIRRAPLMAKAAAHE